MIKHNRMERFKIYKYSKGMMVFGYLNLSERWRLVLRNQYSPHVSQFDLIKIGKRDFQDRIEYLLSILGVQLVVMKF